MGPLFFSSLPLSYQNFALELMKKKVLQVKKNERSSLILGDIENKYASKFCFSSIYKIIV